MKQISRLDLQQLATQAAAAPRLRANRNLHEQLEDPIQRLAIAMEPGTYVRVQRHPHTWELLTALSGRFVVLIFDERGLVRERVVLGEGAAVVEIAVGTWHAVLSLDTGGVIFEVKHGPYQPVAGVDFWPTSPAEGADGMAETVHWYAQAAEGDALPF